MNNTSSDMIYYRKKKESLLKKIFNPDNYVFYLLILLLLFTPLARGSVNIWAKTIIHMITLIALAFFLIQKLRTQKLEWIRTPLDVPIGALLLISIISAVFSVRFKTSFWAILLLVNYVAIFYLVIYTTNTRQKLKSLVYVIIGTGVFLSIIGMYKMSNPDMFPWWNYDDMPGRLTSTYKNADHLAGYMEMVIPLGLGMLITGLRSGKKAFTAFLVILLFAALLLSLSRGGWAGMIIGIVFMSSVLFFNQYFAAKKFLISIIAGSIVAVVIILSSTSVVERILTIEQKQEAPNVKGRMVVWGGMVEIVKDYPLCGTGPGTFPYVFTRYQPSGMIMRYFYGHNDYLQLISETGLPVAIVMLWMIFVFFRRGLNKMKHKSRLVRGITLGSMTGITAILVHSIADFNLHIPANAILFAVLAALAVAPVPRIKREKKLSSEI